MSQDDPKSRKDKKALRDAERRQKGKRKSKTVEAKDLPEEDGIEETDFISLAPADEQKDVGVAAKSSGKRKRSDDHNEPDASTDNPKQKAKGSKPSKRQKKNASHADNTTTETSDNDATKSEAVPLTTKSRFIVFVGNLPYSASDSSIKEHFAKLEPFTLRHRTDPKTKKSKGFAFLEFQNYDRMKTCLKLYHHSSFGGESRDARKINVELTAGGGGKTEGRKEKIRVKNQRLEEQRKRRAEQEKKEKVRKDRKGGVKEDEDGQKEDNATDEHTGVHPSRMARIQT